MRLNKFSRRFLEIILGIIGFFNPIIPKNSKKILFFNSSTTFQNNFALYKYMKFEGYIKNYKIYYYMPDIEKYEYEESNISFIKSPIECVLCYLTSKYVFFDTGNIRIKPSTNQFVINLWHGTPFKRIGFMSKSFKSQDIRKDSINKFTKILVSSDNLDEIYKKSFNINNGQIMYSGFPRNDFLRTKRIDKVEKFISKEKYKKVIMWMTTYRISSDERLKHTTNTRWSDTNLPIIKDLDLFERLNNLLKNENILLIVKNHTTSKNAKINLESLSNIRIMVEDEYIKQNIQLYEILGISDALITDYSSVFIDYLLLDRCIGFITEDIDDYDNANGFSIDNYIDYMPGDHICNMNELECFIKNVSNDVDNYSDRRKYISDYFNKFNRKENCKYILEHIGINNSKVK